MIGSSLIIHHLEPRWDYGYMVAGTSFDQLCSRFVSHLEDNEYDNVILTVFEDDSLLDLGYVESGLSGWLTHVFEYGYGWDQDIVDSSPHEEFCPGYTHSEFVLLSSWMRSLHGPVSISGAFDKECIQDLEVALAYLSVKFTRIEELIVGC